MNNRLLPEICKIQYGFAFDSAKFSSVSGTPLVRIRDVVRGFSETYTTEECSDEYLVQNGDILIGMDGEFNISRWNGGRAYLNQRVCRLIPTSEVDPVYLFYFMPKALKDIEDKTPFVTVKHLSAKELNRIVVPIPTVTEQQKISTVLQSLDNLITLRKQQLSKLDELVKARFVELFGDRYTNDRNWESKPLYECANFYNGKAHEQVVDENGEYILVTSRCIASDITDYRRTNTLLFPLQVNDIAMVMSDVPNGRALAKCILIDEDNKFTLNQRICCLREYSFNPIFFYYLLNRHEYFLSFNDGNAQTNLRKDDLLACNIIIPPLELQNQFATFVEQTDKSKLAIQQSLEKLETLKRALMQQYFG